VLAVATLVFGLSVWWGLELVERDPRMLLPAAPFLGHWRARIGGGMVVTVAVAVVGVRGLPAITRRAPWRPALLAGWAASAVWGCALALATDGPGRLSRPLTTRFEYLAVLDRVGSAGSFLDTFTERLGSYPVHVQGHPPGPVVGFHTLEVIGLGGPRWAALVVIVLGASTTAAAMVTVRCVADEATARAALPYLALAPAAMFSVTSVDGAFMALAAWTIALTALAAHRPSGADAGSPARGAGRRGSHRLVAAAGAGVAGALTCYCTYAAPLFLLPAVAIVAARRAARVAFVAIGAGLVVVAAFTVAGFWWLDGLSATHDRYVETVARFRPWRYFALSNLAVLAAVVGPAALAGVTATGRTWARSRRRSEPRPWHATFGMLVGASLVGVIAADLSGFTKGEVERIWLPFTPWLLVACAALPAGARAGTAVPAAATAFHRWPPWLVAQVVTAVALQIALRSPW
jgi:hypothetical protein